jgi:hypothetical protein
VRRARTTPISDDGNGRFPTIVGKRRLPNDIAWHGETVHTAVWKRTVSGRRMVRRLNIDGDGQGDLIGHGPTATC